MNQYLIATASLIFFALVTSNVQAAEPLEFQKMMKELGKNMQTVTDGISREDWKLEGTTAPLIAKHPQPPLVKKQRIISLMGAKMSKFKTFDMQAHDVVTKLGVSATT